MASISKLGSGKQPPRAIDFVDSTDGRRRKRVRLGIVTHDEALEAKRRIEKLLNAKILNREPDQESVQWLAGIADDLHEKIARHGLCEPRVPEPDGPSLAAWLATYLSQRQHDLKPGSLQRVSQTGDRLKSHFGGDRTIDSISAADAKACRDGDRRAQGSDGSPALSQRKDNLPGSGRSGIDPEESLHEAEKFCGRC